MRKWLLLLPALMLLWWTPRPAEATRVVQLSLDRITQLSGFILVGRVVKVTHVRPANDVPYTLYRFQVEHNLLNAKDKELEAKVFGVPYQKGDKTVVGIPGMPTFAKGDRRFLFLAEPSSLGFTSPVGLEQGTFRVERDARGDDWVQGLKPHMAGMPGRTILTPVEQDWIKEGPMPLSQMMRMVSRLVSRTHPTAMTVPASSQPTQGSASRKGGAR